MRRDPLGSTPPPSMGERSQEDGSCQKDSPLDALHSIERRISACAPTSLSIRLSALKLLRCTSKRFLRLTSCEGGTGDDGRPSRDVGGR
jgi:hypothetical protein